MNTADTRRNNLRLLTAEYGTNNLARKLGYRQGSFITQMSGPNATRDLTESSARDFEKKLGLARGWFDQPHQDGTPPKLGEPHQQQQIDDGANATADVIRLMGAMLQTENVNLGPAKFADLVALAVLDAAINGGKPRENYLRSLINLVK